MKKEINSTFHYYVNWLLKELGEKCEDCFLGVIASTDTTIIHQCILALQHLRYVTLVIRES